MPASVAGLLGEAVSFALCAPELQVRQLSHGSLSVCVVGGPRPPACLSAGAKKVDGWG